MGLVVLKRGGHENTRKQICPGLLVSCLSCERTRVVGKKRVWGYRYRQQPWVVEGSEAGSRIGMGVVWGSRRCKCMGGRHMKEKGGSAP